jgi:hypothetical protein
MLAQKRPFRGRDGLADRGAAHGDLLGEEVLPNPLPGLDVSMKQFLLDGDVGFVAKDRMFHGSSHRRLLETKDPKQGRCCYYLYIIKYTLF